MTRLYSISRQSRQAGAGHVYPDTGGICGVLTISCMGSRKRCQREQLL